MQVLQICHSYYPPFLDCARQYAALFKGTNYRVVTVYLSGAPSEEVVRGSESDEVIFLGYSSKQIRGLKLDAIARIRKLSRQRHFAFCIAHRVKPTYVALLATRLPVISIHHNYNDYKKPFRRWLVDWFRKRLLMLCVSNSVRDQMRRHLPKWSDSQIETLYNRINVDAIQAGLLDRDSARRYLGLPTNAWIIGNVGRLHHDKDQATLIRGFTKALPQLPANSLLLIMGSGPLEQLLKRLAAELGVAERIVFAGQVSDGRKYFRAFDVFALTSDNEPFGMVLLEAMAASVPVICSNCGGGAEVVTGNGSLFPFGDVAALAKCLIEYAEMPDLQRQLITNSQSERLSSVFSDQAAHRTFFASAYLRALLS